jgi:hypothetical protein
MHSTLQTWATEVVRVARTRLISHFAAARFAGSGAATAAAAPLAQTCSFGLLFAVVACRGIKISNDVGDSTSDMIIASPRYYKEHA